jgi:polyribonucleotide nucleotidyltransferase
VGKTYSGRVVNVTKFGAFVNILPGRDGLVHISKLGGGRRIDRVEDVLNLGDALEVVVEDIDPQGKVSLRPVGPEFEHAGGGDEGGSDRPPRRERSDRPDRGDRGDRPERGERRERSDRGDRDSGGERESAGGGGTGVATASFEDAFDAELRDQFGELGPAAAAGGSTAGDDGRSRDGNRRPRGGRR